MLGKLVNSFEKLYLHVLICMRCKYLRFVTLCRESECLTGFICKSTTREEDIKTETAKRIKMNYPTCVLINEPLVILNIMANVFYIFCTVCPLHRERIKQPLKLLPGSLICCTTIYLMSVSVMIFSGRFLINLCECKPSLKLENPQNKVLYISYKL